MKKSVIIVAILLLSVVVVSCNFGSIPESVDSNSPTVVVTTPQADVPTIAPKLTPTAVPTSTQTYTPTAAPTEVPTLTPTSIPQIYEPIIFEFDWDLSQARGWDVQKQLIDIIDAAGLSGYEFTTFNNLDSSKKQAIIVISDITHPLNGALKTVLEYMDSEDIPAVIGVVSLILTFWSPSEVAYLGQLLDGDFQIANAGAHNFGFITGEAESRAEFSEAHNTVFKILGMAPTVLLLPNGLGQDNPDVYNICGEFNYTVVVGRIPCELCEKHPVKFYKSELIDEDYAVELE